MANNVMIKSFKDGILVRLDPAAPFEDIYSELGRKVRDAAGFFGDEKTVVSFEGRELSEEEEKLLVNSISDNSDLTVLCVMSNDDDQNEKYLKARNTFANKGDDTDGQFYKGNIRSHEVLETDSSIIILGDVNPGAKVHARGNIVILGTLYGNAYAGTDGRRDAFIVALDIKETRIQIGDISSKVTELGGMFSKNRLIPRICYISADQIVTSEITKEFLLNLPL